VTSTAAAASLRGCSFTMPAKAGAWSLDGWVNWDENNDGEPPFGPRYLRQLDHQPVGGNHAPCSAGAKEEGHGTHHNGDRRRAARARFHSGLRG
jgi:hypothetical protein